MNNVSILRPVAAVTFATGSIATTAPNGAPWLYEGMITARQAITIPTVPTD
jgi:hypothetical protein